MSGPGQQTVDYDALAQQQGGTTAVDYDALAAQSGGSTDASPQPQGLWDKIKAGFADSTLTKQARANYEQNHGHLQNPGVSEGAGLREGLAEYDKASGGEVGGGVVDILHGNVAKGLHRILSGAGAAATPLMPFAAPAAAAAPITTALSVGGGILGAKGARAAAEGLGATPDEADLASDVGGLAGGYAGAKSMGLARKAALLGKTPEEAYQSALKPSTTIPQAKVAQIVKTGLENEIPVSKAGVEKIGEALSDLQDKVTQTIGSGQGKTIDPRAVASRLPQVKANFAMQVNPDSDMAAVDAARKEFLQNNPNPIPAAEAQAMKVGTYQQLGSKAYGEMQTATKEAQKALARGIKEELNSQFPELNSFNSQEGKLYDLQGVLEKAVNRIGNHQLLGIGTPVAGAAATAVTGNPGIGKVAMVMKAVLDNPAVKSRLAIAISHAGVPWIEANAKVTGLVSGLATAAASANDPNNQGAPSSTSGASPNQ